MTRDLKCVPSKFMVVGNRHLMVGNSFLLDCDLFSVMSWKLEVWSLKTAPARYHKIFRFLRYGGKVVVEELTLCLWFPSHRC